MMEKTRYPQIPGTVWWGVRQILQRTPTVTIDERLLGADLNVQEAAARQYVSELRSVGIITEEGRATPLAQKWRLDESYAEAANEIIQTNYPEPLRALAPPQDGDRQKIINWFLREGLGQGAAGNKAATYLLLGSSTPTDAPSRNAIKGNKENSERNGKGNVKKTTADRTTTKVVKTGGAVTESPSPPKQSPHRSLASKIMPLNINLQIHISADAGAEQIESIFSAMRKYLYDQRDS